jgi:hypothetical protein
MTTEKDIVRQLENSDRFSTSHQSQKSCCILLQDKEDKQPPTTCAPALSLP